jgi:long-chain acyl-CoA synthetase
MESSIGKMFETAALANGDRPALTCGDRHFSYQELNALVNRFANALQSLGVEPGQRVSLYAPNSWQWIVSYYGILKVGAVVNPLNMMLTPKEAEYAVRDCQASVVVTSADKAGPLAVVLAPGLVRHLISFGEGGAGILGFDTLLDGASAGFSAIDRAATELSTIAYTSGTTGHPKGAMLSHLAVLLNTAMTAVMHTRHEGDIVVSALPCAHVYGNVVMNSTFACGGRLVLHERFSESEVLQSIDTYRATLFEGVPTMYMYLLNHPSLGHYDLRSLKRCTVGGQTMPRAKMEQVEQAFGCPLIELWGMTELGGLGATQTLYGPRKHGSIGIALPHTEAKIDVSGHAGADEGQPQVGELLVRGGITMMGYFNNPAATAEVLGDDGWLRTGDLGYQDRDGFIFLVDRAKDLIITGGFNIYPAELERVIAAHPAVALVAVGGIKDEFKGELAKAYVVLANGKTATEDEIIEFCRSQLAPYKVPRTVQFVRDLPKTSTGKVMRRVLEESAARESTHG